ncbi:hypothetical protein [Paenibacillus xylanexedens]|uniref:hypothetical protein n=1 Tax=Paenibacillus xylanexedens TaxID=528191 RepID=UPI0011A88795|nr:hypothetical protein [Paenibacillus xylanexedens]
MKTLLISPQGVPRSSGSPDYIEHTYSMTDYPELEVERAQLSVLLGCPISYAELFESKGYVYLLDTDRSFFPERLTVPQMAVLQERVHELTDEQLQIVKQHGIADVSVRNKPRSEQLAAVLTLIQDEFDNAPALQWPAWAEFMGFMNTAALEINRLSRLEKADDSSKASLKNTAFNAWVACLKAVRLGYVQTHPAVLAERAMFDKGEQ